LYDKKTSKRNKFYKKISTINNCYFGLSPVELVYLNYYFWYCNKTNIGQIHIKNYTPKYLQYFIFNCVEKLRIGSKKKFNEYKEFIENKYNITFDVSWDSFRIDYKKFIIFPNLRKYAAKGIIFWHHVRNWEKIQPFIKRKYGYSKTSFDNIIKYNFPDLFQTINKKKLCKIDNSKVLQNTSSKLIQQINNERKLDNSNIFKIFSDILKLISFKEKMIQLTKSEDGNPSSSIINKIFESYLNFSKKKICDADSFCINKKVFDDWKKINNISFLNINTFRRIYKKLYFEKKLHNIASRGLIDDIRILEGWIHIKKLLPDNLSNISDDSIKNQIDLSIGIK